jgi:predicted DNA-binding protein (UPF0251 family)
MNLIRDIISDSHYQIPLSSPKELQDDLDLRLVSRVLTLYYFDNLTQAEIGRQLNLSTSKVNRLLKFARQNWFSRNQKSTFHHIAPYLSWKKNLKA